MLAFVGAKAEELERPWVNLHFTETSRNMPARRFLESICGPMKAGVCRFRADELAALEWKSYSVPAAAPRSAVAAHPVVTANYGAIADLSQPDRIVQEVRSERRHDGKDAGFTDTERKLAGIWSELLERPITSSNVNFFDAGGHSLLAVLLVVRVRETFGIELPVDDVYSAHLTLADLARKIELYQLSQLNPEEYSELLAEIEALSDEQVQALLAGGNPEAAPS
jgi:acyl carrier protein